MVQYHVITDPILRGMKIPVNPAKQEINFNNITISKSDAIKELNYLNSFESNMTYSKNSQRGLTWSQRMEYSKIWAVKFVEENIEKRYKNIQIVLNNPINIKRWKEQEIQQIKLDDEEKLLQIQLQKEQKENEIKRQEIQKLMKAEKQLKLLKTPENIIKKPESLSLISSVIPLGIIGFLLINSRNDKN